MLFAKVLLGVMNVDLVCCFKHEAAVKLLFERGGLCCVFESKFSNCIADFSVWPINELPLILSFITSNVEL